MKLGIVGCGKMGTAWVEGVLRAGLVQAAELTGVDPVPGAREAFAKATSAKVSAEIADLKDCEVLLLCTKPHDVEGALAGLSAVVSGNPVLVISIAAGIPVNRLESAADPAVRIIRAMPNTPALVGMGASAFCVGTRASREDAQLARGLLEAVGLAIEVPERLMDAVTGLSGSGPAYVYLVIEAMADGGVMAGIPRADALRLAAQTVAGAARMVLETGAHPAILKDMVTSPGGTTISGLSVMEDHGVRAAMIGAVMAATRKAEQLGAT
jgi:pyrroline-5-carboxylate reductase